MTQHTLENFVLEARASRTAASASSFWDERALLLRSDDKALETKLSEVLALRDTSRVNENGSRG